MRKYKEILKHMVLWTMTILSFAMIGVIIVRLTEPPKVCEVVAEPHSF